MAHLTKETQNDQREIILSIVLHGELYECAIKNLRTGMDWLSHNLSQKVICLDEIKAFRCVTYGVCHRIGCNVLIEKLWRTSMLHSQKG